MARGLFMAMEEAENDLPIDETEAADVAVTAADDSAEVQATGDEVGTSVTEIADAVEAGDALQDVGDVAETALEEGDGLDEKSAELTEIAVENILNKIGMHAPARVVPAIESFGNSNTRVAQTKVVLEGITDWIKKIWTAIKNAAIRLWEKIKLFFASLFKSTESLLKLIKVLKQRVDAVPSSAKPSEKTIKAPGVARTFAYTSKAGPAEYGKVYINTLKLAKTGGQLASMSGEIQAAVSQLMGAGFDQDKIKKFIAENSKIVKQIGAVVGASGDTISGGLSEVVAPEKAQKKAKKDSKSTSTVYGPFPGGVGLVFTITEIDAESSTYDLSFSPLKGAKPENVEALDVAGMRAILADAQKLAFELNDFKRVQKPVEDLTKFINSTADKIISTNEKVLGKTGSTSEVRYGLDELKNSVKDTLGYLDVVSKQVPHLMFMLVKGGADYVSLSLRNMK